jgi:hypothetical protein
MSLDDQTRDVVIVSNKQLQSSDITSLLSDAHNLQRFDDIMLKQLLSYNKTYIREVGNVP